MYPRRCLLLSAGAGSGKIRLISASSSTSSSTDSSTSSGIRSSGDQAKFRAQLVLRDKNACLICTISSNVDESVQLEAAHIIPFRNTLLLNMV